MRHGQAGFTLIELMIVVAIVSVLAGIAVFAYSNFVSKARVSEVHAIFAELKLRQEQFHVEHGRYHATGASEADMHPPAPSGPREPSALRPLPDSWHELRARPDQSSVYCAYVAISGRAGDDGNVGSIASGVFGFEAPMRDWYYLLAECNFDGDDQTNSRYFTASDSDRIQVQNQGH